MNTAHIHLSINHFPVFAVLIGLLVLIYGRMRRSSEVTSVALLLFGIAAVATIPAYYTGKGSPRVIRGLPGVEREFTMAHAEAGQLALIACLLLGAVSVWGFWQLQRTGDIATWNSGAVWLLAIVTTGLMFWTAETGGQIRHTEIRPGYVLPTADPNAGQGGPSGGAPGAGAGVGSGTTSP